MKRFNPKTDDPLQYDSEGLRNLKDKYLSKLLEVRAQLTQDAWFQDNIKDTQLISHINWDSLARHLLVGFAVADALQVGCEDTVILFTHYSKCRLIPIQLLNDVVDRALYNSDLDARVFITKVGLLSLAAQLQGFSDISTNPLGARFWAVHAELTNRVVKMVQEEFLGRFDVGCLKNPDNLLNLYNTPRSPLLRSSTMETMMKGMAAARHWKLKDPHWLTLYEQSRQMLDDLADLREDLMMGRLSYPVLLALKRYGADSRLYTLILNLWGSWRNGHDRDDISYWNKIRALLIDVNVFQHTCTMIETWLNEVSHFIDAEEFDGNIEGIITIVDLKRAYLQRLINQNFNNVAPKFRFYEAD